MDNAYQTITTSGFSDYRERGSKFFGYSYPVNNIGEISENISVLRKEHPKATHICSAYRLRSHQEIIDKADDDGEPSGSAGLPILNACKSKNLENVLVAVVRYYGGTKLGVPGLIKAYGQSATASIIASKVITRYPMSHLKIEFDYGLMGKLMAALKQGEFEIIEKNFDQIPNIQVAVKKMIEANEVYLLKKRLLSLPADFKDKISDIAGLKIKEIKA